MTQWTITLAVIPLFQSWIFWVVCALGSALLGFLVAFVFVRKKPKIRPVSDETINGLIRCLGGIENIKSAVLDGARIKFSVVDVDRCDLNEIRNLGAVSVFVSGNAVKFMHTNNADHLIEHINQLKKGE